MPVTSSHTARMDIDTPHTYGAMTMSMKRPTRLALPTDKVRFVGDPVACVVATSVAQAKDAAEAVVVDIDPLPAVTKASEAAKAGAPQLYDDVPGNVALDFLYGDPQGVADAFAKAAHVKEQRIASCYQ